MLSVLAGTLIAAILTDLHGKLMHVSIMGDKAEELGYVRPPGLTPAWGIPVDTPFPPYVGWDPIQIKTLDPFSPPEHLSTWLSNDVWHSILSDWADRSVADAVRAIEPLASRYPELDSVFSDLLRDAILARKSRDQAIIDDLQRRAVAFIDLFADLDTVATPYRRALFSTLYLSGPQMLIDAVEHSIQAQAEIDSLRGGSFMQSLTTLHDMYVRQLSMAVDEVAPWRLER